MTHLSVVEQEAIAKFKTKLQETFGPRIKQLKLFGSRAEGRGHEWSDLDVFVLIDTITPRERDKIFEMAAYIELETEIDISPLIFTEDEFKLWLDRERRLALETEIFYYRGSRRPLQQQSCWSLPLSPALRAR